MASDKSDTPPIAELCLPALDSATSVILQQVTASLGLAGLTQVQNTVQIVLAEALNNIAEHAYYGMDCGAVAVRVYRFDRRIEISLTDWGRPLPGSTVPTGIAPDPTSLSEGGYGWFLIHSLVSDVSYVRKAQSNHLVFALSI